MKSVVEGQLYDTETATRICQLDVTVRGLRNEVVALYVTKKGNFFLAGSGDPSRIWHATGCRGGAYSGTGVKPVARAEALRFCEEANLDPDVIATHFGDMITEA